MLPPNNLPTMLGISNHIDNAIADALSGKLSLDETLARLSNWFLVKAWFSEPIKVLRKTSDVHVFKSFFISEKNRLCYGYRRHPRTGRPFYDAHLITKLEFIDEEHEFNSYEEFKKKFDTRFIKEDQILHLWNGTSSQHGKKFNKKDFRKISKRGKEVMDRFLKHFTNINEHNEHYHKSDLYKNEEVFILKARHESWTNSGRDISISHQTNAPHIFYSSEYRGCLNGRYGLVANKNEFLHLEDD